MPGTICRRAPGTAWSGAIWPYGNGMLLDAQLETRDPKVQHWLAILSFKKGLGVSTRTADSLLSSWDWCTVVFVLILRREFLKPKRGEALCAHAPGPFPVFLLNIRQCRYYAPPYFWIADVLFLPPLQRGPEPRGHLRTVSRPRCCSHFQYLVGGALSWLRLRSCTWFATGGNAPGQDGLISAWRRALPPATVPFLLTHPVWIRAEAPA